MNNLRATIDILFRKLPTNQALDSFFNVKKRGDLAESAWNTRVNQNQGFYHLDYYSHNELQNVWQKVEEDWAQDAETGKVSVFGLLHQFGKTTLKQMGHDVAVDYPHLLRWRELSHLVGEDLLTTCFFAQRDKVSRHQRTFFAWRPVLSTNNHRLKKMLEMGVAENHFHLQGSAPHYQITWIALMNRVTNRKREFKGFQEKGKLEPETSYGVNSERSDLHILVLKAAYIRMFLFQILQGENKEEGLLAAKNLETFLNPNTDPDGLSLISNVNHLQREINSYRLLYGKLIDPSVVVGTPDYCIPKNIHEQNFNGNILLCGERKFLYDCFQAYFKENEAFKPYSDLFYAYLLIKSKFREEMIQINKNVGFTNFQNYQGRKMIFLESNRDIYLKSLYCMAIQSSHENQSIKSFEARISPKGTKLDNTDVIQKNDKAASSKYFSDPNHSYINEFLKRYEKNGEEEKREDFFYVPHFIKSDDKAKSKSEIEKLLNSLSPRNSNVRQKVKVQAQALMALRNGINQAAKRIYGIDAASSEFSCRPEAFSQAYRFLKYQRLDGRFDQLREKKDLPVLKATFHAGEDFYDLVDGLRAIDEAIKFLNLGEGDRLGHALALGINPREYYEGKQKDLMLPKQWHLDNISWLISRINKYNLHEHASYASYLQWEFRTLFNEIYGHIKELQDISPELYYESWKLRGDDPSMYLSEKYEPHQNITFWQRCAVNEIYPDGGAKRKVNLVNKLYHLYHFDVKVKEIGKKIKRFEVKNEYIKVVESVQKHFQLEVAEKHLGIETNPSSNYLIGTFKRYDKHPLVNFFNLGLELDPNKLQDCPQLFVSINTDDQGVFNTYLENEYALMALALEKMEDEDGKKIYKPAMIYDWLDRIRQMGLEMSFKQD